MNKITEMMDSLDLSKLVPELDELMAKAGSIAGWAVMIGPLVLLIMGLIYCFKAPKEANHHFGFRTYFAMGSVEAWQNTQRLAGIVFGGLGIILTIVMGILCLTWRGKDVMLILSRASRCLIWEVVLAALAYIALVVYTIIMYDKNGNRRK